MLSLLTMLSTAAVLLFADAANTPVSLSTVPIRPEIKARI